MILFTDTQDTEEPRDNKKLLAEMTKDGSSVSVIGLGTKGDIDAALCEDIAKLGNGRIFFSDRPMDIPQIFAQETVTIARSAFLEESVGTLASGRWGENLVWVWGFCANAWPVFDGAGAASGYRVAAQD